MEIQFTTQIFKEGRTFVAHTRELDVSSCSGTRQKALQNLKEAVQLFPEEAGKMCTLEQILEEAGYLKRKNKLQGPKFIATAFAWRATNMVFTKPGVLRPVVIPK